MTAMERRRHRSREYQILLRHRQYFGVEPLRLRAAAARVVARVAGLPPDRARVTARQLQHDFGVDTAEGQPLLEELVAGGLLETRPEIPGVYGVTPQLAEIAGARIIDPLPRARARELVADACTLAAQINALWARIPLEIDAVATFGSYMSRDANLGELSFGVVVRARPATRRAHWRMATKAEGAGAIRTAFRGLDPFVRVRLFTELQSLPRPFAVVFQAD
jgi:hypothetical protein